MTTRPKGVSERNWQHYQQGYQAQEAGKGKDESAAIQDRIARAWWLAGWHDAELDNAQ